MIGQQESCTWILIGYTSVGVEDMLLTNFHDFHWLGKSYPVIPLPKYTWNKDHKGKCSMKLANWAWRDDSHMACTALSEWPKYGCGSRVPPSELRSRRNNFSPDQNRASLCQRVLCHWHGIMTHRMHSTSSSSSLLSLLSTTSSTRLFFIQYTM